MPRKHNPSLTPRAKELRKSMTEQEKKLWYFFLRHYPVRILRQKVIDNFIVDFYCSQAKLVIEIDGSQHFEEAGMAYDNERTAVLNGYNLDVIRFTNYEVNTQFKEVCEKIDYEIKKRIPIPPGSAEPPSL